MSITRKTELKLAMIAKNLYQKWGLDVINFTDFISQALREAKALNYDIIPRTIKQHERLLVDELKRLDRNAKVVARRNAAKAVVESPKQEPKPEPKSIVKVVVHYSDGSLQEITCGNCFISEENKLDEVIPQPSVPEHKWYGIFDYKADGSILIQKQNGRNARFNGCDITNPDSIREKFRKSSIALEWIEWALAAPKKYKTMVNPDVEKNIATLNELKNKIKNKL